MPEANRVLPFSAVNARLSSSSGLGQQFFVHKLKVPAGTRLKDVFLRPHGVYGIHCSFYHHEDIDFEFAEGIPHYMTYNADTRYLNVYPHVSQQV
jgi:hypothetical protein